MSDYLFIDGAYFREAYSSVMTRFYGNVPDINWSAFSQHFGRPKRIYYYDSIDRLQVGAETLAQRDARVANRDTFHAYLNSLPNWHVREGFVSRGRRANRRSQKAVDVQLAVDALEHAVARNMGSASFILGDLDFEPLFFSLNRFGIKVSVWYEEGTASSELLEAADVRSQMTLQTFSNVAVASFKGAHTIPSYSNNSGSPTEGRIRQGSWNGRRIDLFRHPSGPSIVIWAAPGPEPSDDSLRLVYGADDQAKAELAFTMHYGGTIVWRPM